MRSNRITLETWPLAWCILLGIGLLAIAGLPVAAQGDYLPIGTIQGTGNESPYRSDRVSFRGVVTGFQEDQNTRGAVYYTAFVQDVPGEEDGDPLTSDAIAVFFGRNRPQMPVGAMVLVSGEVTEFYGFTEIDDDDLRVTVERLDGVVPEAIVIDPPADLEEQRAYFEPLEGMRVSLDGQVRVTGPTHEGCGFAVVAATDPPEPIFRRQLNDPTGRIMPVLYPTDVDCTDMAPLKTGDLIDEVSGVLIYNFDEFKILLENPNDLAITPADLRPLIPMPSLSEGQVSAATVNTNDWFDGELETGDEAEPVLPPDILAIKETKLAEAISEWLNCPTLVAIEEVEHEALLLDLANQLTPACGFTYTVSHVESADPRGIDNALLTDPNRVTVQNVQPQQVCSPVPTDHEDVTITCEAGDYVLFDRPPLKIDMTIDGYPYVVFVNHFKSKREGEAETALERLAQARFQNALAADLLAADPGLRLLVMGDLNDYELSAPLLTLTDPGQGGQLTNALSHVPEEQRYSFVFSGAANLLDAILVSPALSSTLEQAGIFHINADFPSAWTDEVGDPQHPYRFSDHDLPWIIWDHEQAPEPTAAPLPTETRVVASPTAEVIEPTVSVVATITVAVDTPVAVAQVASPGPLNPTAAPETSPAGLAWLWIIGALAIVAVGALVVLLLRRSG